MHPPRPGQSESTSTLKTIEGEEGESGFRACCPRPVPPSLEGSMAIKHNSENSLSLTTAKDQTAGDSDPKIGKGIKFLET